MANLAEHNDKYEYEDGRSMEDMNTEEKLTWLKERGVESNLSPEEMAAEISEAGGDTAALAGKLVPCFKYVRIPVDKNEPFEELWAHLPLNPDGTVPAGDQIPGIVKSAFAKQGHHISEGALQEHARSQLGSSAAAVTPRAFAEATKGGSVETFALVRPAAVNQFSGVYIYLDEIGVLKELPANPRGAALAAACGHPGVSFHGELFVGRVTAQPAPMRNTDFLIKDMNSGCDWIKTAPAENYQYSMGMKEVEAALAKNGNAQQIKMGGFDNESMPSGQGLTGAGGASRSKSGDTAPGSENSEGESERGSGGVGTYRWTQTKDDVELIVPLPEDCRRAKALSVILKSTSVSVRRKGVLGPEGAILDVPDLNAAIHADESTWTIEGSTGDLVITMEKARNSIWRMLSASGQEGE